MLKRMVSFLAVNILVMITVSLTLQVLGICPDLMIYGINDQSLMVFCFVWGLGGAAFAGKSKSFISLFATHPPLEERIARWEAIHANV